MKYNIYIYITSMPSDNPKIQKAFKDGVITKGQYDKLSDGLLLGIIKKKGGAKAKPKSKGVKEVRKKTGKAKGKPGRPKGGSMVKVEK
tara:strand:+ start:1097 stop:1360 length:264 start_codon:yes stop_codon:yes gene_type:complete